VVQLLLRNGVYRLLLNSNSSIQEQPSYLVSTRLWTHHEGCRRKEWSSASLLSAAVMLVEGKHRTTAADQSQAEPGQGGREVAAGRGPPCCFSGLSNNTSPSSMKFNAIPLSASQPVLPHLLGAFWIVCIYSLNLFCSVSPVLNSLELFVG
jgi:hypothetical protein